MDINLPDVSGITCVAILKARFPDMLFLMCTNYADDNKVFASLKAGASGYILKSEGPAGIIPALKEMLAGGSPMSMEIARKVVASFAEINTQNPVLEKLTNCEARVLEKLAQGMLNKEVAENLNISKATVRTHSQKIYSKLHVNTRVEAVNIYLKR